MKTIQVACVWAVLCVIGVEAAGCQKASTGTASVSEASGQQDLEKYQFILSHLMFGSASPSWHSYVMGSFFKKHALLLGVVAGLPVSLAAYGVLRLKLKNNLADQAPQSSKAVQIICDATALMPMLSIPLLWYVGKKLGTKLAPFTENAYELMNTFCANWVAYQDKVPFEFQSLCNYFYQDIIAHGSIKSLDREQVKRCLMAIVVMCLDKCNLTDRVAAEDIVAINSVLA